MEIEIEIDLICLEFTVSLFLKRYVDNLWWSWTYIKTVDDDCSYLYLEIDLITLLNISIRIIK